MKAESVINRINKSLPMRERGLKFEKSQEERYELAVAPHAGAWIEIAVGIVIDLPCLSLPMRERGLKCGIRIIHRTCGPSLPMRERGLKCTLALP